MKNSYEMPEIIELGQIQGVILGVKVPDPIMCESILGCGWRMLINDIDENDE